MEGLLDTLQARVLQPIAQRLFPFEGCSLDRHHSFVVQYEEGTHRLEEFPIRP